MIYQLFTGRYIDFSKLIAVSEILDGKHMGDPSKEFYLIFQLLENPIIIKTSRSNIIRIDGSINYSSNWDIETERDKIISQWSNYIKNDRK
jgi:hypothetical protein